MTQFTRFARIAGVACMLLATASAAPAAAADDPALLAADHAFVSALGQDGVAAVNLLDADASWTDADGRTIRNAEISAALPKPAIGDETGADMRHYEYGRVGVVQVDKDPLHTLRVWIKRDGDWRLLAYQEVRSLSAPPTATPGVTSDCINPCRSLPYTPKNDDERGVVAAYQALETSSHAGDASAWGARVADEFILISSNSDRTMTKSQRLEGLRRANKSGVAPVRLLDAQMTDENGVVVMRAHHAPDKGDHLYVTRVWVKRDNAWQETLSYQTTMTRAN